jgi:GntR family transcriptional regulator
MFKLDLSSNDPIYLQIVDQTKEAILADLLKEGDQMPSIREMAKTLLVNQSTVTRAYRELEDLGIIKTVAGRGTFISLDPKRMEWEKEKLKNRIESIFREALFYGFSEEDLKILYKKVNEEGRK